MGRVQGCFLWPVSCLHLKFQMSSFHKSHSSVTAHTCEDEANDCLTFDRPRPGTQQGSDMSVSLSHPFISIQFDSKQFNSGRISTIQTHGEHPHAQKPASESQLGESTCLRITHLHETSLSLGAWLTSPLRACGLGHHSTLYEASYQASL